MMPNEALDQGGVEILRAGLIDDELYVTARRVFADVAVWGEVLADIARRLALIHSAEGEYTESEALAAIESAFAADLGATAVKAKSTRKPSCKPARKPARKPAAKAKPVAKSKSTAKSKPAPKSARATPARQPVRPSSSRSARSRKPR
jgi:hypothetical protein